MLGPRVVDEQHVESVLLAQLVGDMHECGRGSFGDPVVDDYAGGVIGHAAAAAAGGRGCRPWPPVGVEVVEQEKEREEGQAEEQRVSPRHLDD